MTAPNAALPILDIWRDYFLVDRNEGLGSSYERIMLNRLLSALCQQYGVTNVLEAPSFGFTGLSGINSLWLTKQHGIDVTLADTNQERLELIQQLWREANVSVTPAYIENYSALPFADQSFQFSWNFAAIWLLDQPEQFLRELTRVTRQVILIAVPNQHGLGYYMRKWLAKGEFGKILHESAAVPQHLIAWMDSLHWKMVAWDYLDVPSWPDIAMKKEDFAALLHLRWLLKLLTKPAAAQAAPPLSIMDYYTGKQPDFEQQMLRYAWIEQHGPRWLKYVWAHHKYFVFEPVASR